jgi:GTP diphosphokinase / guanosine-3',5'-bis(diphosphate) 3'-diphosphatase
VPLVWADRYQGDYLAEVRMRAGNKRGLLANVTSEIAQAEASIENVHMPDHRAGEVVETRFVLAVRDRTHLARVIRRLRRLESVERVFRP